jgi:hypothetical protein
MRVLLTYFVFKTSKMISYKQNGDLAYHLGVLPLKSRALECGISTMTA